MLPDPPKRGCPHGEDLHQRALTTNCSKYHSCNGEPLVYHCVKHVDGDRFIEICSEIVMIKGKTKSFTLQIDMYV